MRYRWDRNKSVQENAESNGVSYGAMESYKWRHRLASIPHKKKRLERLRKVRVIEFLYKSGFTYADIARLFKVRLTSVYGMRFRAQRSRILEAA